MISDSKRREERDVNGRFAMSDYAGVRVGYYTIINYTGKKDKRRGHIWNALCDCGTEFSVGSNEVNRISSCGCKRIKNSGMFKAKDITGTTVKDIEAVEALPKRDNGYVIYKAKCSLCGNEYEVPSYYFVRQHVRCNCEEWKKKYTKKAGRKRNPNGISDEKAYYSKYVGGAKSRGLEFSLTLQEFNDITKKDCFYCGASPKLINPVGIKEPDFYRNGIDRINNSVGYVLENCVPCCSRCNVAKMDLSVEEFYDLIRRIYWHSIEKR